MSSIYNKSILQYTGRGSPWRFEGQAATGMGFCQASWQTTTILSRYELNKFYFYVGSTCNQSIMGGDAHGMSGCETLRRRFQREILAGRRPDMSNGHVSS